MNKIDDILDEMDEVLDKAKTIPFSGDKKAVNTDRLRDLIDDVRLHLPAEIKEARGIVFDKDRILNAAKEKSNTVIRQAEKRAETMVMQDNIVREAKKKALDILTQAKTNASKIMKDANEYTESLMSKTERFMTAVLQDMKKTKSSMKIRK